MARPLASANRPAVERSTDKALPPSLERGEATAVLNAINAAAEDIRTFPQAASYLAGFTERYPNSKQRRMLQQKFDILSQARDKAVEERRTITQESKLFRVEFEDADSDTRDNCLGGMSQVKAAAIVQKALTVQAHLPSYFILADVDWPKAKSPMASAKPQQTDGSERSVMVEKITACFRKQAADGTVTVMFWSDPGSKAIGPIFAKVPDALVYTRD